MEQDQAHSRAMSVATVVPFLALTFGLTWGLAVLILIFTDQIVAIFGEIGYTNPIYILAVYAPAFAAIFLVWRYYGIRGLYSYFRRLAPMWAGLVVGVIRGVWYLPAFLSVEHSIPSGCLPNFLLGPRQFLLL